MKWKIDELIEFLKEFNELRRGAKTEMPKPEAIGIAIDEAIEYLKSYRVLWKDDD